MNGARPDSNHLASMQRKIMTRRGFIVRSSSCFLLAALFFAGRSAPPHFRDKLDVVASAKPHLISWHILLDNSIIVSMLVHIRVQGVLCSVGVPHKWECNKWGLKRCLPSLPENRAKIGFCRPFLPFSQFSGGSEEHLENPGNGGKGLFFLKYPPICLNPHLRHSNSVWRDVDSVREGWLLCFLFERPFSFRKQPPCTAL